MPAETTKTKYVYGCPRCGKAYPTIKNNFYTSYAPMYKGTGTLAICKECTDALYAIYYRECHDEKKAMRQVCRKLDIYWNDVAFDQAASKTSTRSLMSGYCQKITNAKYVGKCYDDTLKEEGTFWEFATTPSSISSISNERVEEPEEYVDIDEISDDVKRSWGSGYTATMYMQLERRREYWMGELKVKWDELDAGTKALIRQICSLELDINRDRANGKAVDKSVATLNTLLGSAMLKPSQKKEDLDSDSMANPLGVWLHRYEYERPLPDIDERLKDKNKIKKYIFTWMGHLCKMLGIKNGYTTMYEAEINRLRVERPEYVDEDDEVLINDAYSEEWTDQ